MDRENGVERVRWKAAPAIRALAVRALDLAWPESLFDGGGPAASSGFSAEAWSAIRFLDAPWCDGCGSPFPHDLGPGARCTGCETRPLAFDRARAACLYDERSRELVLQFKHGDRLEHARLFARWLSRCARELIADAEAVTPVPLHPLKLLRRRYNQAAEVARPLAREARAPYLPDVLVRTKGGGQAGRSRTGRRREVAGAFSVPERKRSLIAGRRILLVDDVMTTGATADACARALKRAGAKAVDVAVVARVPDGRDVTI